MKGKEEEGKLGREKRECEGAGVRGQKKQVGERERARRLFPVAARHNALKQGNEMNVTLSPQLIGRERVEI